MPNKETFCTRRWSSWSSPLTLSPEADMVLQSGLTPVQILHRTSQTEFPRVPSSPLPSHRPVCRLQDPSGSPALTDPLPLFFFDFLSSVSASQRGEKYLSRDQQREADGQRRFQGETGTQRSNTGHVPSGCHHLQPEPHHSHTETRSRSGLSSTSENVMTR